MNRFLILLSLFLLIFLSNLSSLTFLNPENCEYLNPVIEREREREQKLKRTYFTCYKVKQGKSSELQQSQRAVSF